MRFGLSLTDGVLFTDVFSIALPLLVCLMTLFSVKRIPRSQRIAASVLVVCVTLLVSALSVFFLVGNLRTGVVVGNRMVVETPPFASVSVERGDIVRAYRVADPSAIQCLIRTESRWWNPLFEEAMP